MPIKGLTNRGLSFPEIGRIKKGIKEEKIINGKAVLVPKDLWYFNVQLEDAHDQDLFESIYGKEPTKINVMLPFHDISQCWSAYLEAYTASRMVARSDGDTILYQVDSHGNVLVLNGVNQQSDEGGGVVYVPEDGIVGKDYKGNDIKLEPVGRLRLFLPELQRAAYVLLVTTSKWDISNLDQELAAIELLTGGQPGGKPLVLSRKPRSITIPMAGGTRRMVRHLLHIELHPDYVKWKLAGYRQEYANIVDGLLPASIASSQTPVIKEITRPYEPTELKAAVEDWAEKHLSDPITDIHRSLLLRHLVTSCEGSEDKAMEMLYFLTDHDDVGMVEDNVTAALVKDWMGLTKPDDVPSTLSITEAKSVLDYLENFFKGEAVEDESGNGESNP
jgi:hypothetical protein